MSISLRAEAARLTQDLPRSRQPASSARRHLTQPHAPAAAQRRTPTWLAWWACVPLACSPAVVAQNAVSPVDRSALEGNSFTHYPLGRASARVQTLHDDVPGGTVVSAHGYRRDAVGVRGVVAGLSCELQVTLSVAPHPADSASSTFASNTGSNAVVVLPRQTLAFPSTDRPALDPAPAFELVVPYAQPFTMPPQGGTLCVDVEVFGNQTSSGINRDVSLYLDAHQQYADGSARQRGFRTLQGCAAPGSTARCYAGVDLWRLASGSSQLDVSLRNGVADPGSGAARAFLTLGNTLQSTPWPLRPECLFHSSAELWFALPGAMTATGRYDGSLTQLPPLPSGLRLWCQAGSVDLASVAMAFSDAVTLVTPPLGQLPRPCARVANGADVTSPTGSVSASVPVMAFF